MSARSAGQFPLENPIKGTLVWKTPRSLPSHYPSVVFAYPDIGYRVRRMYPTRNTDDLSYDEDVVFVVVGCNKLTQMLRLVPESRMPPKWWESSEEDFPLVDEETFVADLGVVTRKVRATWGGRLFKAVRGLPVVKASYADGNWEILNKE